MCYTEECAGCEERAPVVARVISNNEKKAEIFVIRPVLREEDLERAKKVLRKSLKAASH